MVTTFLPPTSDIATPQARTASPSRCTVQAPHSATPQPNFVPVSPSSSRRYHISGIVGSPSNERCCPFTLTLTMRSSLPLFAVTRNRSQSRSPTALKDQVGSCLGSLLGSESITGAPHGPVVPGSSGY